MTTNVNDGPEDSGLNDQYLDLTRLLTERARELANTTIEAARAQPMVATAAVAGFFGAMVGLSLARRQQKPSQKLGKAVQDRASSLGEVAERARKGGKQLRKATDYGELLQLGMRLLENPIVRGLVLQTITKRLTKRFR